MPKSSCARGARRTCNTGTAEFGTGPQLCAPSGDHLGTPGLGDCSLGDCSSAAAFCCVRALCVEQTMRSAAEAQLQWQMVKALDE
eukprot:7337722-Prymnesium_polylepis.1